MSDLREHLAELAVIPVDSVTLTVSSEDIRELVELLSELDGLRWERTHDEEQRARYPEFRPTNGHWHVQDGAYSCVGEIESLDVARARVALEGLATVACKAVITRWDGKGKVSAYDIVTTVLDVVAQEYAGEGE